MAKQMSPADARKHGNKLKQSHYSGNKVRVAKRKDRNVRRSSHGKYKTVAELLEKHPPQHRLTPKPVQYIHPPVHEMWGVKGG